MSKGEPMGYEHALSIAKQHLVGIAYLDSIEKITIVGSLRRRAKEVKDIDYQVKTTPSGMTDIEHYFWSKDWECKSSGDRRAIFLAPSGVYVNVFNTDDISWGAALIHNTGPRTYNIRKRYLIKKRDMILNQYGLYERNEVKDDPVEFKLIAGKTEKDIYDALGWAYCKPEDRK